MTVFLARTLLLQGSKIPQNNRGSDRRALSSDRKAAGGTGFFIQKAQSLSTKQRKQMIDPSESKMSVANQCRVLKVNRSSFYYKSKPMSAEDLELMRLIDEHYLNHPSAGSRSMRNHLRRLGYKINRKRVQRLMRLMPYIRSPKPAGPIPSTRYIPTC